MKVTSRSLADIDLSRDAVRAVVMNAEADPHGLFMCAVLSSFPKLCALDMTNNAFVGGLRYSSRKALRCPDAVPIDAVRERFPRLEHLVLRTSGMKHKRKSAWPFEALFSFSRVTISLDNELLFLPQFLGCMVSAEGTLTSLVFAGPAPTPLPPSLLLWLKVLRVCLQHPTCTIQSIAFEAKDAELQKFAQGHARWKAAST